MSAVNGPLGAVAALGNAVAELFERAGYTIVTLVRGTGWAFRKPRLRVTLNLMYESGIQSLPVVAIMALFAGMIISLQTGIFLEQLGQSETVGSVVAQTFAREFGPFMTCIILVGTVVSSYTAEIGTMAVSEEISALEVLSVRPVSYLVAPRVVALTVMTFFLTIVADIIGVLGGGLVAMNQLGLPMERYLDRALSTLSGREWGYLPKDVYAGLLKAAFTGWGMAGVGCAAGLRARGGALGVGRAVRTAVITSIVLTLIISYNFSWVAYQVFPS